MSTGIYSCCDIPIRALTLPDASRQVLRLVTAGAGADVHLCNAYTLALADRNKHLTTVLQRATLNLPDGMSVVIASRRYARPDARMHERVYGPDLMLQVTDRGREQGLRHYLYGGADGGVLAGVEQALRERFPGVVIAGSEVPPFTPLDERELVDVAGRIAACGAQIVWVGLGTPKQDLVAADLAQRAAATFVAVGAAYDFLSGAKRQAPRWMQRRGLEWLYRLAREPRRLWRRYLFGNARFLYAVLIRDRRRSPDR